MNDRSEDAVLWDGVFLFCRPERGEGIPITSTLSGLSS